MRERTSLLVEGERAADEIARRNGRRGARSGRTVGEPEPASWAPTVRTLGELLNDPEVMAEQRLVVPPLVAEGEVALLSAPPKTGKSHFVSQLAADLSRGRPAIDGTPQEAADVLWIGV